MQKKIEYPPGHCMRAIHDRSKVNLYEALMISLQGQYSGPMKGLCTN